MRYVTYYGVKRIKPIGLMIMGRPVIACTVQYSAEGLERQSVIVAARLCATLKY